MLNRTETSGELYARAIPQTPLRRAGEEILLAWTLLTRIPAPGFRLQTQANLGSAFWAYPLIGAAVGAIGAAVYVISIELGLGMLSPFAMALAAMTLATGAFHEDGLGDFMDGIGGGQTRERKLEIMRDSRLGTYGVMALVTFFLLSTTLLFELENTGWQPVFGGFAAVFICVGAFQRAALGVPLVLLKPVRSDGLAADTPQPRYRIVALGILIATLISLLLLGPGATVVVFVASMLSALGVTWLAWRQLGGRTGDALGAAASLAGVVSVAALVVFGNA
jgi:adenosylcobinamide-GDP ribazoletransferase